MSDSKKSMNVLVTGGARSAGLATVKALRQAGHTVVATATEAAGALAIRQLGALPVYPDLSRASEVLSALQFAKAEALVHAAPQLAGGNPQIASAADAADIASSADAVFSAAAQHGIKRAVSLSFAYLSAIEGGQERHQSDFAPLLAAEAAALIRGVHTFVIRAGYIYGGNSPATAALAAAIKNSKTLPAGEQPAAWIHEDDLASAILALLGAEVEAEDGMSGSELLYAASAAPQTPNEFAAALAAALGLSQPRFANDGLLARLRQKTARDTLLSRATAIELPQIQTEPGWQARATLQRCGWQPRHDSLESGLAATALTWRMQDAVNAADYYTVYEDKAAAAIKALESGAALPAPVAPPPPKPAPPKAEPPAPPKAAAPAAAPAAAGPTPWTEDEAKREERRRKALERRAKRAAKRARN